MAQPTAEQRRQLAKMHIAMPDGSFYIRNRTELSDAINAVGRATPNAGESDIARRNAVRRHVINRAKALKLESMIPVTWNPDGSLKQFDSLEDVLIHFGIKGMKWGQRRSSSSSGHTVSSDAARASTLKSTVKKHGTSALSNEDLQHLVTRLNLERQHGQLNPTEISVGRRITHEVLKIGGDVARQQASSYASKYTDKGIKKLIERAA